MRESDIESYLVKRVKFLGGEIRKVQWVGRSKAPDRLVLTPLTAPFLVEVKSPEALRTFPSNGHERAQQREHDKLRKVGMRVELVGTIEGVDALLQ